MKENNDKEKERERWRSDDDERKRRQARKRTCGPWWWLSGQHARLLLRRSEFETFLRLQFFSVNLCLKRTKINKKEEAGVGLFLRKRTC